MDKSTSGFLGQGWSFPPKFEVSVPPTGGPPIGLVTMVQGDADIEQSLEILMMTISGERIMRPTYGLGLQTHVFDVIDENNLTFLRSEIEKSVLFYEPRIELEQVAFDTGAVLDGRIDITLEYTVIATNTRGNKVFPYYFEEGTHVEMP
ncbi:GPW/gp25 family protein [uncultured Litoreibacter sp.]|uniref:GPW/gp25 family protein n=1 Tax=uncultured Litoreibacter sp. TaxID=1392394 RepID=UPI0026254966|nr:GPW/gp25 family protein [uncultured Litoreibacter sp.]